MADDIAHSPYNDITNPPYLERDFNHLTASHTPPKELIYDDGAPLESHRHRIAMNVLIDSTLMALKNRSNFFAGGNMFVYYSEYQAMNRDYRGPDYFLVLDVKDDRERKSWIVWEEDGRYPDVIVEFLSASTAQIDTGVKKELYEQTFRTKDYFVYDPFDPTSLRGWHLNASCHYQPLQPNPQGWLWCETLNLWLGTWNGSIQREPRTGTCAWLRFYSPEGELIPLEAEQAQHQAEQERQRAERLAERLRELGEDPNGV